MFISIKSVALDQHLVASGDIIYLCIMCYCVVMVRTQLPTVVGHLVQHCAAAYLQCTHRLQKALLLLPVTCAVLLCISCILERSVSVCGSKLHAELVWSTPSHVSTSVSCQRSMCIAQVIALSSCSLMAHTTVPCCMPR